MISGESSILEEGDRLASHFLQIICVFGGWSPPYHVPGTKPDFPPSLEQKTACYHLQTVLSATTRCFQDRRRLFMIAEAWAATLESAVR